MVRGLILIVSLVSACNATTSAYAQTEKNQASVQREKAGIRWLRSAQLAAEEAARTGKPILVYVRSATCHWCDRLQRDVWEDPSAIARVQRDFIPLKLTREENAEALEALKIKGFPATMVFSPERKFLRRKDGYFERDEFLDDVANIRTASAGGLLNR